MQDAHQRVREATQAAARFQKKQFNAKVRPQQLEVGDHVWLYWPRLPIRQAHKKLTQPWTGPFQILAF
jgi:hypothetical protein